MRGTAERGVVVADDALVTGGALLVQALKAAGVRHVWGLPGTHTLPVWDALIDETDLRVTFLRNEQDLPFAAKGFHQASGAMCAVITVPGPGSTHLFSGLIAAGADSAPILVITATPPPEHVGRGCYHDCDLKAVLRPAVKAQLEVGRPEDLWTLTLEAVSASTRSRPGPVQLLVPGPVLQARTPRRTGAPTHTPEGAPGRAPAASLSEAARLLRTAARPLLYAGGGVATALAEDLVRELARILSAPVVTSVPGRGVIPEDDPLAAGAPFFAGVAELIERADAVVVIATRFSQWSTGTWSFRLPDVTIRIDTDEQALQLNCASSLGLVGDLRPILSEMIDALRGHAPTAAWREPLAEVRRQQLALDGAVREQPRAGGRIHPARVARALRSAIARDTVVAMDGCGTEMWFTDPSFPIYAPRTLICSEVFQELGSALPLAIGAAVATGRPTVCISGDGGILYTLGELSAVKQDDLPVKILVFDDGGNYNSLRQLQQAVYGRNTGTYIGKTDFDHLSSAFGIPCWTARSDADLDPLMCEWMDVAGPALLVAEVDPAPAAPRFRSRIEERRTKGW